MKRWLIGLGATAVVVGGSVVAFTDRGSTVRSSSPSSSAPRQTATVKRTDLIDEDKLAGVLGYGEQTVVGGAGPGTITAMPDVGTVLKQGDTVWQVDGHLGPALFYGTLPMWRALRSGATNGPDVAQLEQNLAALGFGEGLTIDDTFDSHTTAAIKAWQASRWLKKTGAVTPSDIVLQPGPVRVAEHKSRLGATPGAEVLAVTGASQLVTLDVAISKLTLLTVGASVQVQLPDDRRVDGQVASIGKSATTPSDGGPSTIKVTVGLSSPVESLDVAPVKVIVSSPRATGVLTVPINALVALAEGGYAVEKVDGGSTTLVGVKPGEFGDGIVAVSGDAIAEGDSVVVAS